MRCSKCQYISFDNGDRCRNCGYEFLLSVDQGALDLPMRTDEPSGPLADFSLADPDAPIAAPTPPARSPSTPPPATPRREEHGAPASGELPLFRSGSKDDDAPLVKLPAVPRAPVSVRKSTAHRPPQQQRPVFEEFELDLDPGEDDVEDDENTQERFEGEADEDHESVQRAVPRHRTPPAPAEGSAEVAPVVRRILAAVVDLGLLVGMDVIVLRLTLRICGLQLADAAAIPVVPFGAFLVLLNGGYVAAFTAVGGQTIGKMLTGIRVVTAEEGAWTDRVRVGQSALRALGYLLSALPAGLGFLPVLIGGERRGVHDRLAHTRVVKA